MHTTSFPRSLVLLVGLAAALAPACGDEELPASAELDLREYLGLSPERAAELDRAERTRLASLLYASWEQEQALLQADAAAGGELALEELPLDDATTPGDRTLRAIGSRDAELARLELPPPPVAQSWEQAPLLVVARPLLAPSALGLEAADLLRLANADDATAYRGFVDVDDSFGGVAQAALGGRSEREAMTELEPLVRRLLGALDAQGSLVRVHAVARTPVVLWYAADLGQLWVNPNLLYLFDYGAGSGGGFETRSYALALDFVEDCVDERLNLCMLCNENSLDPNCAPVFAEYPDLASECAELGAAEADGYRLFCYGRFLELNDMCFAAADPSDTCGARAIPVSSTAGLDALGPMLDDEFCQRALLDCESERTGTTPDTHVSSANSAGGGDCANECLEMGCEAVIGVLVQIACQACIEGIGESSGCSADSGSTARAPARDDENVTAAAVAIALPFALLGTLAVLPRRRRDE